MSSKSDEKIDHSSVFVWIFLILTVIWAIVIGDQFGAIHLQHFDVNKMTTLLVSLFSIALFFERCIEVIVAIFRNKKAAEYKNELDKSPTDKDIEKKLTNYRLETQSISLRVSFIVGIAVSAMGIRILGELVDIPQDIGLSQKNLFNLVDIFITAGVLAGGSDGIHQLMTVYDDYMKYFSKTATNKTEIETKQVKAEAEIAEAKAKQAKAEAAEAKAKKKAVGVSHPL